MTLINLPEGRTVPEELGGGVAVDPIEGLTGCYEGMTGWIQFQWPELKFKEYCNAKAQQAFFDARVAAVESGDSMPPELDWGNWPPEEYGIGDTPQQVMAHPSLAWVHTDPREFVVVFTEVRREDQSPRQGWRFHKHGSYIGEHNVEMEYLYDQDGIHAERIDCVVMYHVIQVLSREEVSK